jgi:plasmid stabilization system protein ParE
MVINISPSAREETIAAARYYEAEVDGLGRAFMAALRIGFRRIQKYPTASTVVRGEYRRHLLDRFPFGIIYRIDNDVITVVAIMHLRRKPDYWQGR